jgi:hypothetical protein
MKSPAVFDPTRESETPVHFSDIGRRLPFNSFREIQDAITAKKCSVGVDPLAAAEWSATYGTPVKRFVVSALSVLLMLAALAAIVAAVVTQNYWLLLALPIQAAVFYLANSNTAIRLWVTVGGVVSLLYFFNLLLNDKPTAATLVAYTGLTFAAVRASSLVTNSAFRKALLGDEALFARAFTTGACTVRNNQTKEVYAIQRK